MMALIARHECAMLLRSLATWLVLALLAILFGFHFLKQLEAFLAVQTQLAQQDHPVGLTGFMSVRYLEPLALVFTVVSPLLAMRSFSDEMRHHTLALWQSSPVSHVDLVLGKFLGVLSVILAASVLCIALLASLRLLAPLDWAVLASAWLGLALCASAATACGLWFSSLTRHAMIAIIASLALLLISWMLGSVTAVGPSTLSPLSALSIASHLHGFFQGYIRSRDVAFFVLMSMLFLGLTTLRMSAMRIKGHS